ncbi:MAG: tRNA pseudouridine(55) synthase TruB [Gemmatimonadota bacterium]
MKTDPGLLLVDKPPDVTSHDVVRAARGALAERRIGHTGTLDPFATGLLLLCVGSFTRAAEYFHALEKTYSAALRLGQETDTDDLTGTVEFASDAWRDLDEHDVVAAIEARVGESEQVPPAFSAKRVAGVRSYSRARAGSHVELEPVPIVVHEAGITACRLPEVEFEVTVSTGTYVRALARDLGRELGCGAHLVALRRTRVGPFDVTDAYALSDLPTAGREDGPGWRGAATALPWLERRALTSSEVVEIEHGRAIPATETAAGTVALVTDRRLVGIGEVDGDLIRPRKVFPS